MYNYGIKKEILTAYPIIKSSELSSKELTSINGIVKK
jgi:hypothetical protein